MPPNLSSLWGVLVEKALESRIAEMLVAVAVIAMVLNYIAYPLQHIPDKMDTLIVKLSEVQQEIKSCAPLPEQQIPEKQNLASSKH